MAAPHNRLMFVGDIMANDKYANVSDTASMYGLPSGAWRIRCGDYEAWRRRKDERLERRREKKLNAARMKIEYHHGKEFLDVLYEIARNGDNREESIFNLMNNRKDAK